MMAYRYDNSIVLALEKNIIEEYGIENDGREAVKKARDVLKEINIEQKLESVNNKNFNTKVQEYVVLIG